MGGIMKTEKNIFIAFILNLTFSLLEFWGGIITKSTAIMSDAVHDLGDATVIGISWFLERKSNKSPDFKHYSVIGGIITTLVLILGSLSVIFNAIFRILNPVKINYDAMILFAIFGVVVNFTAAYVTHKGHSVNQKAVNLHMLEDVFGWLVVLIGAVVMRFTDFYIIDPILSILVSIFILFNAVKNLKEAISYFKKIQP